VAAFSRWVLRHGRLVVSLWLVLAIAGAVGSSQASKVLTQQYSVPGHEGYEANQTIASHYGNGGNGAPLLVVVTLPKGATVYAPAVLDQLKALDSRIAAIIPSARETSYAWTGNSSAFVSRDGRTTFALVYPRPDPDSYGQAPETAKRLTSNLAGTTIDGSPVRVTGLDALNDQASKGSGNGVFVEVLIGAAGALAVLIFVFASFLALVPLLMAACSILTTFLFVWGLAEITSVSTIVEFLVGLVGLGIAIDYSLLIVVRWQEERSHGTDNEEAIVRTMQTAGRAVVFSGTTVAIGLLALLAIPVPFLRSLGYGGVLISMISVLAALTLSPLVLRRFGPRLDWPHRRSGATASRAWTRWGRTVVRFRWPATIAGAAVLVALIVAATGMNLGTDNPNALARTGEAKAGLIALEHSGIGSGMLTPTEIIAPADRADTLANSLGHLAGVRGAIAPDGPSWRRGSTAIVDVFTAKDGSTRAGRAAIGSIRSLTRKVAPTALVGGQVSGVDDFIDAVYGNFPLVVVIIAVLTFLLLARAFRSILLPLKAIVVNLGSVAAAWGALTLIWQHGIGSHAIFGIRATGAIPEWIPLMVFAFLFGLSMDYEVFIIARMREAYDYTGSTDQAVVSGISRTGRLVTSAAIILFLSFVAMASAPQSDIKMLATALAVGILVDATIVRSLLVPAVVSLLGRFNWWLPPGAARLLRVPASVPTREPPRQVVLSEFARQES
jgi:putative drug exporter of the RND superfamily